MLKQFKTLTDLMITFSDNQVALNHFKSVRWRGGEFCPYCGHDKVYTLKENRYQCAQCRNSFSILVGTIFENTKLPLAKWFGAIWLLTNHPKGIASTTLAKDLGITQKSAWFVLHRLRHAARTQSFNTPPLSGKVEMDETFVGGKARNRHANQRGRRGAGVPRATSVIGVVERGGSVIAKAVPSGVGQAAVKGFVEKTVARNAQLLATDTASAFSSIEGYPQHEMVNHRQGEFVRGEVYTQTIESVWSLLKRQINGTHHWVSPKHLDQYVSEMAWRQSRRKFTGEERMNALFADVEGRLTYKALIA